MPSSTESKDPGEAKSLHVLLAAFQGERGSIERELLRVIEAHPGWHARLAPLQSVRAVGLVTALTAAKRNPAIKALDERLRAAGEPPKWRSPPACESSRTILNPVTRIGRGWEPRPIPT